MKLKKFIKTLGLFLFVLGTSTCVPFMTTSCSESSTQDHYDYIGLRTFSIGAIAVSGAGSLQAASSGTMWFYERLGEYRYEFITNYHVYDGIRSIISEFPDDGSAWNCLAIIPTDINNLHFSTYTDYIQWSYSFASVDELNNFIDPIYIETQKSDSKHCYMDMCAITIDFYSAYKKDNLTTLSGTKTGVDAFKHQIDYLNSQYKINEKININKGDIDFGAVNLRDRIYIAGYPWDRSPATKTHNTTQFTEISDLCEKWEDNYIYDFGGSFKTEETCWKLKEFTTFALGGGASGSMVVNERNEVVGIYWGGSGSSSIFIPMFALFRTTSTQHESFDFFATVDATLAA